MTFINWNEDTLVNFEKIDSQHKEMVDVVNELYDKLEELTSKQIIEMMHGLLEDLKFHFFTEEDYMKKYKFHGYISHKLEHDRFIKNFAEFIIKLENDEKEFDTEFLNSFRNWFLNHLELNDKKLGKFMIEKEAECS